ncbi:hypothetical protein [Bizionia arctica]|uniref:Uncharacterized protein n=1 Tax=Bizionia arctica TaxID=1495645 RepID=A0A917GBF5_9FLAO|nr:hypothetical protein [Bizionia arctica]GGG35595.1 hypothetical protein GCM10010976_04100 [Bizionia arctica]
MKLEVKNTIEYIINNKRAFIQNDVEKHIVLQSFDFAFEMIFGSGHHRNHRSGGLHNRPKGELFANTFQGKMAEFVVYNYLTKNDFPDIEKPDTSVSGKGIWDAYDLMYKNKKINIKSATFFSNLLLLECKDWNKNGEYIPNIKNTSSKDYDYFILVRIKPDIKKLLQIEKLFSVDFVEKTKLQEVILNEKWFYDFGGICSKKTIKHIINEHYFLPQNALLNGKIKIDADNYYIQCGDLKDINFLLKHLKEL